MFGGTAVDAGVVASQGATSALAGACGLTGTLTSCYAEVIAPTVGNGCAGVLATMLSCVPTAPRPVFANPSPQPDPQSEPTCRARERHPRSVDVKRQATRCDETRRLFRRRGCRF
ncbi:hypothetical protein JOF56_009035 [Kibdelosporangium banguiense]|uniref:Uncharacterized protein n=1 Tax=Kibdelosporangium banguiense TaxID=1365924 RepID=A0ABS4TW76_9PSEU|nr:hypothetical protein [Kibdelosporangium banguiense]